MSAKLKYHISEFIKEEMEERGWDRLELARRMGGDFPQNLLVLDLMFAVQDQNLYLDKETADQLSHAFGVSAQFFINIDLDWHNKKSESPAKAS